MKLRIPSIFIFTFICLSAVPAVAQEFKNGVLSGTIISASATAPDQGAPVLVYQVPAVDHFILTQVCITSAGQNSEMLSTLSFGSIARVAGNNGNAGSCTTYDPGLALPPGEDLSFQDTGNNNLDSVVTITGILSKK